MKTGLVLEGGAMRGLFTSGILDVLMERGMGHAFDGMVGVSAGACFGCNFKSEQPGRVLRYNRKYCTYYKYGSYLSWILSGDVFDVRFCYDEIPNRLDPMDYRAFENHPMEFYAVATSLQTGLACYKLIRKVGPLEMRWIRASASLPLLSRPVPIGKDLYLDGGMSDSVPLAFMEGRGYEKNVVILTRPDGYEKKEDRLFPLMAKAYRNYPAFVEKIRKRPAIYNAQLAFVKEREASGRAFVFRPEHELNCDGMVHDPDVLLRVYNLGRSVAKKRWDELQAFLAGDPPRA